MTKEIKEIYVLKKGDGTVVVIPAITAVEIRALGLPLGSYYAVYVSLQGTKVDVSHGTMEEAVEEVEGLLKAMAEYYRPQDAESRDKLALLPNGMVIRLNEITMMEVQQSTSSMHKLCIVLDKRAVYVEFASFYLAEEERDRLMGLANLGVSE